jgi:hypothetical protein
MKPLDILDSGYCVESCPVSTGDQIKCADTGSYAVKCNELKNTYATTGFLGYCFPTVGALKADV